LSGMSLENCSGFDTTNVVNDRSKEKIMNARLSVVLCLLLAGVLVVGGCGKKADENKPISEVQADAEKMNADELKAMVDQYTDAIAAKQGDVEKLAADLKEIPVTEMLTSEKAKSLKADMGEIEKSVSALSERMKIYADELTKKGG
jgi:polyhydroxyalkanoate synthesis regulator phasin